MLPSAALRKNGVSSSGAHAAGPASASQQSTPALWLGAAEGPPLPPPAPFPKSKPVPGREQKRLLGAKPPSSAGPAPATSYAAEKEPRPRRNRGVGVASGGSSCSEEAGNGAAWGGRSDGGMVNLLAGPSPPPPPLASGGMGVSGVPMMQMGGGFGRRGGGGVPSAAVATDALSRASVGPSGKPGVAPFSLPGGIAGSPMQSPHWQPSPQRSLIGQSGLGPSPLRACSPEEPEWLQRGGGAVGNAASYLDGQRQGSMGREVVGSIAHVDRLSVPTAPSAPTARVATADVEEDSYEDDDDRLELIDGRDSGPGSYGNDNAGLNAVKRWAYN